MTSRLTLFSHCGRSVRCGFKRGNVQLLSKSHHNSTIRKAQFSHIADQKVNLALFGVGRIGQIHIGNLISNPRVDLRWIVEGDHVLANDVIARHGLFEQVKLASLNETARVLEDKSIHAVFICTPTETHTDLIKQALLAGKHVLCEKPISEDTADIISCFDTAEKCGKTLMAAFNRKFDPSYRDIYNRVKAGELGKLQMIRSTFRDTPLWLGAQSLSQTFLIHDVGILYWLADSLPESLFCMASASIKSVADKGDVDTVVVTMKFPGGTIGILEFCRYSCYGYDIRLEVFGTEGMLTLDTMKETSVKTFNARGSIDPPIAASFPERFERAYQIELDHFIDVVKGNATLDIRRQYSVAASIVTDAIIESYNTGQVVYLPKTTV